MSHRTIRFLHLWLERNDLLDGRSVDEAAIGRYAKRLFTDAEAEGISDTEIEDSWDELHKGLLETMRRRHRAPPMTQ